MLRFIRATAILCTFVGAVSGQDFSTMNPGAPASQASGQMPAGFSVPSAGSLTQNPLMGGIPTGERTEASLPLSLSETIKRGLSYNLGTVLGEQSVEAARGARLLALSQLLPKLSVGLNERQDQVNLAVFGFKGAPGTPTVVGPFNVFDVRAYLSQSILDFTALNRYRASVENAKAAQFANEGARDLVVFVCANLYLQTLADSSRIESTKAQVQTAQVLYDLAVDRKAAGVVPGIEILRAQVELHSLQQRLIVAEDVFAKDKLALARAVGLPLGQEFHLTGELSFSALPTASLEDTVQRAYKERPDILSAEARVRAAEAEHKAAKAGRLPTLNLTADYGDIGQRPWESHGTFTVTTSLRIPLYQGGSVKGRVVEAESALRLRRAELEDLRGGIYYDVRNAFLDLKASAERVLVARSAVKLAEEQVTQAHDRFRAGVANNVEVVQAQEAQATANENYISSLQAHSAAKLALAKATGISGAAYEQFLRGEQ